MASQEKVHTTAIEKRVARLERLVEDLIAGEITVRHLTFADAAGVGRVVVGVDGDIRRQDFSVRDRYGNALAVRILAATPEETAARQALAGEERERRVGEHDVEGAAGAVREALRGMGRELAQPRPWARGLRDERARLTSCVDRLRSAVDRAPWCEDRYSVLLAEAEGFLKRAAERLAPLEAAP